jgi:hypothetical protein
MTVLCSHRLKVTVVIPKPTPVSPVARCLEANLASPARLAACPKTAAADQSASANSVTRGDRPAARRRRRTPVHRVRRRARDRPRARDPSSLGGCGDPLCVAPLCRTPCHRAYDEGRLDLLPHLEPAWRAQLAHAVGHVGLIGALRRISGLSGFAGCRPPDARLSNRPREDLP